MKIEISCDATDAVEFRDYLIAEGYDACVGSSTGSYIDGMLADFDEEAAAAMNRLWSAYCNG